MNTQLPSAMKAAVNRSFGPPEVVQIEEFPIPLPKPGQVLVKIFATTVSAGDWRLRSRNVPRGFGVIMGLLFGFKKPRYRSLGTEFAGEIVAIGEGVQNFSVGDRVVANLGMKIGGHAQYFAISEKSALTKIPAEMPFDQAAAMVFGGTTSLYFLKHQGKLQPGEKLLVIGAGGAVGSAAVQLGRAMGAQVTAVCSTEKVEAVRALKVEKIIDYKKEDWRKRKDTYDVIFDTAGGVDYDNTRHLLSPAGRLLLAVADLPLTLKSAWQSATQPHKIFGGSGKENAEDLALLCDYWKKGVFQPVIGARFPLSQIVAAHRIVESGHKLGSVVVEPQA